MNTKGNVNKIILVGQLGQTPELTHTPKGTPVLHISLATNRGFRNAEGEIESEAVWHRATVWGKQAEICAKYLTKGSRVYLEGELLIKSWLDKDGQKRKTPEINVNNVTFLGGEKRSETREEESATALAN